MVFVRTETSRRRVRIRVCGELLRGVRRVVRVSQKVCRRRLILAWLKKEKGFDGCKNDTALISSSSHVGQITIYVDHDLDHLDPKLPSLWYYLVQDMCSAYPTQDTCPRWCKLYGSHAATRGRSYRSYRSGIHISALKDLDREERTNHTNHLSQVWSRLSPRRGFSSKKAQLLTRYQGCGTRVRIIKVAWNGPCYCYAGCLLGGLDHSRGGGYFRSCLAHISADVHVIRVLNFFFCFRSVPFARSLGLAKGVPVLS